MITDIIAKEFLCNIKNKKDKELQKVFEQVKTLYDKNISIIYSEFSNIMTEILKKYNNLYLNKHVDKLRYIYISYLRTSILDRHPVYRIDFYDKDDRVSLVECEGYWSFNFIFNHLYIIRDELEKEFVKQTKVKLYELDKLIIEAADTLHTVAMKLFPGLLKIFLEQSGAAKFLKDNKVKIMVGEFLGKVELLYDFGLMDT